MLREHRVPFPDIALLSEALEKLAVAGSRTGDSRDRGDSEFPRTDRRTASPLEGRAREVSEACANRHRLPDLRDLSKHLGRAIQNGEVDEKIQSGTRRGSVALSKSPGHGSRDKLESMVRNPAYSSQLQDQLITVRNGRFVIPVGPSRSAASTASFTEVLRAAPRSSWNLSRCSR